jgi:hypothetical protein
VQPSAAASKLPNSFTFSMTAQSAVDVVVG